METWDEIHAWMPWAKGVETLDEMEIIVRKNHAKFILREDFMMIACERDTNRPVVFTGIHDIDWETRRMETGYWCRKSAMGIGLVTESTNAMVRYAFNILNARTVAICHAHDNVKSRRVIERLNFHYEGRLRNATLTPDGKIHDHIWYSHTDVNDLPPLDVTWGGP
ncbi:MAG: GCN5-related N-acetyltransferase [Micavibrio sp.]|nr:GCN5-related N-acetyltransferase [Micavibrio sp.]